MKPFWEGIDDVEVRKIGEGETGLAYSTRLTAARLEAIAEWFATPDEARTIRSVNALARAIGASPASIRKWARDPRMLRRVREKTNEFLVHVIPNVAWSAYKNAMKNGDMAAAKLLISMVDGPATQSARAINIMNQVNVQQNNQNADVEDDMAIQEVNSIVERRVRGKLALYRPEEPSEIQGDQGEAAVEAVLPDSSNREVPQVEGSDPSTSGS